MYSSKPEQRETQEEHEENLVKWLKENYIPQKDKNFCRATNVGQLRADLDLYEGDEQVRWRIFADEKEHTFAKRLYYINKRDEYFQTAKDYMWKYHGRHTYVEDFKLLRKLTEKL